MPPKSPNTQANFQPIPQQEPPVRNIRTDPHGISRINFINYKTTYEENQHLRDPQHVIKTPEQISHEYDTMTDEALITQYRALLQFNRRIWEYSALAGLPTWIQNSGNTEVLTDYLNTHQNELTFEQDFLLRDRLRVITTAKETQMDGEEMMAEGKFPTVTTGVTTLTAPNGAVTGYVLDDAHLNNFQTSGNGCWSCFLQIAGSSRGSDITQEDIRAYRPDLSLEDTKKFDNKTTTRMYNTDYMNNAMDMADGLLSRVPNTMMCETEVMKFGGISQDQYKFIPGAQQVLDSPNLQANQKRAAIQRLYVDYALNRIKETIIHAVRDERSPVGVLLGKHYITIVGIDGDTILYKDSSRHNNNHKPDDIIREPIGDLFRSQLMNSSANQMALQFSYLKDITVSKDGRTIFGVPSDYVKMYTDGTYSKQPEAIITANSGGEGKDTNQLGNRIGRQNENELTSGETEFVPYTFVNHKVYLPKKLNADFLLKQAENRTAEEENRLRSIDRTYLKLNRPDFQPELDKMARADANTAAAEAQAFDAEANQREQNAATLRDQLNQQKQTELLFNGFTKLYQGKHPEIYNHFFFTAPSMSSYSWNELNEFKQQIGQVFGQDNRGSDVITLDSVLQKFTYVKNGERVNLFDDVKTRLKADPAIKEMLETDEKLFKQFKGEVRDSFVNPYVIAELFRLLGDKNAKLVYENGDQTIRDLYAKPPTAKTGKEFIESLSDPTTLGEKLAVQKLQDLYDPNIPKGETELFDAMTSMSMAQLKEYSALYDTIFGEDDFNPDKFTIHIGTPITGIKDTSLNEFFSNIDNYHPQRLNEKNSELWRPNAIGEGCFKGDKSQFQKTAAILAGMAGLTLKQNGKELPSLQTPAAAVHKKIHGIKTRVMGKDVFNDVFGRDNVPGGSDVLMDIQNTLRNILGAVEAVDQSSWISSSKQFTKMKKELKELQKIACEDWSSENLEKTHQNVTYEQMSQFLEKADSLKKRMEEYLEHKERQFQKDPSRRTAPGKQSYEQPRIKCVLESLDRLHRMTKKIEEHALNEVFEEAQTFFKKDMQNEHNRRSDPTLTDKAFENSLLRSAERAQQRHPSFYTRQTTPSGSKETLLQARERILNALEAKYDDKKYEQLRKDQKILNTASALLAQGGKRCNPDFKMIETTYKDINDQIDRHKTVLNPDADDLSYYRNTLLYENDYSIQSATSFNATRVPYSMRQAIERVDALYSMTPNLPKEIAKNEGYQIAASMLMPSAVQGYYPPIGAQENDFTYLSNKDFAALAYAGALGQEAYAKSAEMKPADTEQSDYIRSYTSGLGSRIAPDSNTVIQTSGSINQGRTEAQKAMEAYKLGNKAPLGALIKNGIQTIVEQQKNNPCIETSAVDAEMAQRMINMLNRDSQLMDAAKASGLRTKDIEYIKNIEALSKVEAASYEATHELAHNPSLTAGQRSQYMEDIIVKKIVEESQQNALKIRNENKTYQQRINGAADPQAVQRQYPPKDPVMENLGQPSTLESLHTAVKDMIRKTTLGKAPDAIDQIQHQPSLTNLLKTYKNAPKENGIYNIQKLPKPQPPKKAAEVKTEAPGKSPVKS